MSVPAYFLGLAAIAAVAVVLGIAVSSVQAGALVFFALAAVFSAYEAGDLS